MMHGHDAVIVDRVAVDFSAARTASRVDNGAALSTKVRPCGGQSLRELPTLSDYRGPISWQLSSSVSSRVVRSSALVADEQRMC